MKPGRGKLLIASPEITELFFSRAVIYILESDVDKGYIGLVLNHQIPLTLGDLVTDWEAGKEWPMHCGGPVEMSRLFMLHTKGDEFEGSTEISPGLYVGGDLQDVCKQIEDGDSEESGIRFFMGYSGWEAGQLEAEIKAGDWVVADAGDVNELLKGDGTPYWRRYVLELGEEYRSWSVMPEAPQIN